MGASQPFSMQLNLPLVVIFFTDKSGAQGLQGQTALRGDHVLTCIKIAL